jgi:hypothetical protein
LRYLVKTETGKKKNPEGIYIMFSSKPCTATCVINGALVTLHFYPDSHDLRICDAYGTCIQKSRWLASWSTLLAALREFVGTPDADAGSAAALVARLRVASQSREPREEVRDEAVAV